MLNRRESISCDFVRLFVACCTKANIHAKVWCEELSGIEINYFQDEDGKFTAEVPAIRGCIAWGKTLDQTYRNAVDAIESCIEARQKVAAKKMKKSRYA